MPRISSAEVFKTCVASRKEFRTALDSRKSTTNFVVKLTDSGSNVGWGEACPSLRVLGETSESIEELFEPLLRRLIGKEVSEYGELLTRTVPTIEKGRSAKASIDQALHDLLGKQLQVPVYKFLGGIKDRIETSYTIGIDHPTEMAKEASEKVAEGFTIIKVKIGEDLNRDIERINLIQEAVGDNVRMRVDCNQGYNANQALDMMRLLEKHTNVQFVEQPIPRGHLDDLALLRKRTSVPVMLDEDIIDERNAVAAIRADACDFINIKLMKSAGIYGGSKIATVCEAEGIDCMVGCYNESGISIAAGVHFALGSQAVRFADLDSDLMLEEDLLESGAAWTAHGERGVQDLPGFGDLKLREKRLGQPIILLRS